MTSTGSEAQPLSVLYVDDEPALLDIGQLFLERTGDIAVTTTGGAEEGLRLIADHRFDAIVSDYQMPGMNGIAFLKHLRQSGNTIPFIIFTGKGREDVVIEALNSGADFYLQKGGDPKSQFAELINMIHAAVAHKNAEKFAKETEKRLYDIIQFLPDPTFAIDSNGIVIIWNQAIEEMTGISAKEMIGKGNYEYSLPFYGERRPILIDLVSKSDEELLQSKYAPVRREGDVLIAETSLPRPLGRYTVLACRASPLYTESGDVVGAIETIRDITEQKEAEKAVQKSERLYRLITENMTETISILDLSLRFTYVSPSVESLRGLTVQEAMNQSLDSVLVPESLAIAMRTFQEELEREAAGEPVGVVSLDLETYRKDGSTIWINNTITVLRDSGGTATAILIVSRDVTERRRAGLEGKMTKRLLEAMLDGIPDIVGLQLPDHTILRYNKTGYEMLGLKPEEIDGRRCYEIIGRSSPCELCATSQAVGSKKQETVERYIPELGMFMECTSNPVPDENGEIELVIEVLHDITERKEAEDALLESQQKFKSLFMNMIEGSALHELIYSEDGRPIDYRIIEINAAFERVLGVRWKDAIGKTSREIYNVNDPPYLEEYAGVVQSGEPVVFETYFQPMKKHFIISAYKTDEKRFATIFEDITEQKLAVEELLLKDASIDASLNGLAITDLSGDITYANPAFLSMWGVSDINEVLGESIPSLWTAEAIGREIADSIQKNGSWSGEVQGTRKDGSEIILELATSLVRDPSGAPIAMMGSCIDITDRKKEEKALQSANKKLQILSSVTRHDILNKIMVIDGYIWLKREKEGDQQDMYLADIEKAVKSIERQIEFTRQYENLGMQAPVWIPVRDLIEPIDDGRLPIIRHLSDETTVFADPMIERVFENLMENTLRHAEGASRVEIRCEERDGQLAIIWEDDGPGVPDEQKERIFERGFGKHTGFGLFLSREILAITGITIAETGEYGEGARFEILVPEGAWRER
ncbi:PAS domain S-box protein [Methanocalculus sp.]|uniref:PAS domain S-box protein n=1 Tax=Methanocalculus sp. TaxID=2004547 RepID=UPI001818EC46|nr:PAS domain S-box protein [Methanocalculus sp.]HIJ07686.1 PAS domain S-box protein [Methanocalculus sp.]